MHRSVVLGMILLRHENLNSWMNVRRINLNPFDRQNIRFGLHFRPFMCLMVETRPTLLEDHDYAPLPVQDNPGLRWIFGKPDLVQKT